MTTTANRGTRAGLIVGWIFGGGLMCLGLFLAMTGMREWQRGRTEGPVLIAVSLVFAAVGAGIAFGVWKGQKKVERARQLREQFADQPWQWEERWASGRISSEEGKGVVFIWLFAVFWNGVTLPAVLAIPRELEKGNKGILFILLFVVVGLGLLYAAITTTLRWKKFGSSVFEMASVPGVPGRRLGGVVHVNVELRPEDGFRLKLSCVNRVTTGSGKNRRTSENLLWEEEHVMQRELLEHDWTRTAIPVSFKIPSNQPETSRERGSNDTIHWKLDVTARVPGLDYQAHFEVPVFRTGDGEAETGTEEDIDPAAPFRAKEKEFHQPPQSGIRVRIGSGKSKEILFAAARNPGAATAFTLVLGGLMIGMMCAIRFGAPIIFTIILGLIAAMVFLGVVSLWFKVTRIVADKALLRVYRGLLTAAKQVKSIPTADVKDIALKVSMQMGNKLYYDIHVHTRDGKETAIAHFIRDKREAEWLIGQIREVVFGPKPAPLPPEEGAETSGT